MSENPLGLIEGESYEIRTNGAQTVIVPFLGFNQDTEQYFFNVDGRMTPVLVRNINTESKSPSLEERMRSVIGPVPSFSEPAPESFYQPPLTSSSSSSSSSSSKKNPIKSLRPISRTKTQTSKKPLPVKYQECIICMEVEHKVNGNTCDQKCRQCTARWHHQCIEIWFKTSRTCPNCRLSYEGIEPINLTSTSSFKSMKQRTIESRGSGWEQPSKWNWSLNDILTNPSIPEGHRKLLPISEAAKFYGGSIFLVYQKQPRGENYVLLGQYVSRLKENGRKRFSLCGGNPEGPDDDDDIVNRDRDSDVVYVVISKSEIEDHVTSVGDLIQCLMMGGKKTTNKTRKYGRNRSKSNKN